MNISNSYTPPNIVNNEHLDNPATWKEKQNESNNIINNIMQTSLSQIGLSNLLINCLKKSKVITVRDVANLGLKKLGGVQGLNKHMRKELLDKLRSIGVSMLLRRLKAKLLRDDIRYILTSATLGGENDNYEVAEFAQNLCDSKFNKDDVIRAKRVKLETRHELKTLSVDFYNEIANLINAEPL